MASQSDDDSVWSDDDSASSEYLSQTAQRRLLDLSDNEPTFHTNPDDESDFVLTLNDPEFAEFLIQRLQLAAEKELHMSYGMRCCLNDIDKHNLLSMFDIEVSSKAIKMLLADKEHPPTIAQLKKLPSALDGSRDKLRSWFTVYVGILEKKGQKTYIYIGSCASIKSGSSGRITQYRKLLKLFPLDSQLEPDDDAKCWSAQYMAKFVDMLLQQGYRMTSSHILFRIAREQCSPDLDKFIFGAAPIAGQAKPNNDVSGTAPIAGQVKPNDNIINLSQLLETYLQATTIGLEAVSTGMLWAFWRGQGPNAIDHKTEHFFREICPFDIDMFEYHGLCSHSPLSKGIRGFMMTAADREALFDDVARLRLNVDGTMTWRSKEADTWYWAHLMEDGKLHSATEAQKQTGEDALEVVRNSRRQAAKRYGYPYIERPIAESPILAPTVATLVKGQRESFRDKLLRGPRNLRGWTGSGIDDWRAIHATLQKMDPSTPETPPAFTTAAFFDGVLQPIFGNQLGASFHKRFWNARFTDISTYRWTPAECLRRISATFLLRLSEQVPDEPPPRSTCLYPSARDVELTVTPALRKLYDQKHEWLNNAAVQKVMDDRQIVYQGEMFWNVSVNNVPSNLAELIAHDGQIPTEAQQSLSRPRNTPMQQFMDDRRDEIIARMEGGETGKDIVAWSEVSGFTGSYEYALDRIKIWGDGKLPTVTSGLTRLQQFLEARREEILTRMHEGQSVQEVQTWLENSGWTGSDRTVYTRIKIWGGGRLPSPDPILAAERKRQQAVLTPIQQFLEDRRKEILTRSEKGETTSKIHAWLEDSGFAGSYRYLVKILRRWSDEEMPSSNSIVDTAPGNRHQGVDNDFDSAKPPQQKGRTNPRPARRSQSVFAVLDEEPDNVDDATMAIKRPLAETSTEVNKPKRRLISRKDHAARNEFSDDEVVFDKGRVEAGSVRVEGKLGRKAGREPLNVKDGNTSKPAAKKAKTVIVISDEDSNSEDSDSEEFDSEDSDSEDSDSEDSDSEDSWDGYDGEDLRDSDYIA